MTDLRSHPEQDEEHEGASPGELLIEACRRNNTDLLSEVIEGCESPEKAAELLNNTKTVLGNYIYHEAALRGHYEVIDMLLDQDGFECDPISQREGDTPLHSAVRFANENPGSEELSNSLIEMMLEAGSDTRVRNKAKLTPLQLVYPSNVILRKIFEDAEDLQQNRGDFVDLDAEEEELPEDFVGSASDSDFDPEEFKREREARARELQQLKAPNGTPAGMI